MADVNITIPSNSLLNCELSHTHTYLSLFPPSSPLYCPYEIHSPIPITIPPIRRSSHRQLLSHSVLFITSIPTTRESLHNNNRYCTHHLQLQYQSDRLSISIRRRVVKLLETAAAPREREREREREKERERERRRRRRRKYGCSRTCTSAA